MKFLNKDLFIKCNQIHSLLPIWSHFLNKSLMENFIFCAVFPGLLKYVVTYDCDSILRYMDSLPKSNLLSMVFLTTKLCTQLCLLRAQRSQSIDNLKVEKSVLAH